MISPRRLVSWTAFAALPVLVVACGDKVTVTAPSAPIELFRGVQQFLAISSLLISESREFWGGGRGADCRSATSPMVDAFHQRG